MWLWATDHVLVKNTCTLTSAGKQYMYHANPVCDPVCIISINPTNKFLFILGRASGVKFEMSVNSEYEMTSELTSIPPFPPPYHIILTLECH